MGCFSGGKAKSVAWSKTEASVAPAIRGYDRLHHVLILLAAGAVPALGRLMAVSEGRDDVVFSLGWDFTLPPLCVSRLLGFRCPTCGLTRSVVALMHGDLAGSLGYHRFGWLIFAAIVAQIPYRAYRLVHPLSRIRWIESMGYGVLIVVAITVILNHFFEQVRMY